MAAIKTENQVLDEIRQRVIRVETRLLVLGTKLGFDLKDDEYIEVLQDAGTIRTEGMPVIVLKTLDVPYTSVIRAARRAGLHKRKVRVYYDGDLIAEMPV